MEYSGKDDDDDRSLPMSKWMRRTDRFDFDCASSPPADGFFYAADKVGGGVTKQEGNTCGTKIIPTSASNTDRSVPFVSSFATRSDPLRKEVLNMNSSELKNWAKNNIRGQNGMEEVDTAPTPIDHLPQYQPRVVPKITKTMEDNSTTTNVGGGGPLRLVDKFTAQNLITPDITPSSTPSITPVCSPQVARRPTNPFFTDNNATTSTYSKKEDNNGSWLFRPGTIKESNVMYEAKVEIQGGVGQANNTKNNVRYVPKPSKLRELNFFSPTSM
jgi:hypothetical protein